MFVGRTEGRKEGGRKDLKGRLDLMVFLAEVRTGGREGEGARRRRRDYIVKTAPFSKFNQGWNMEGRKEEALSCSVGAAGKAKGEKKRNE